MRVTTLKEEFIGIARADEVFHVYDGRGAKESARRNKIRNKALKNLDKSVPDINVGQELIEYGKKQLPVIPNEPDGVVSVNQAASSRQAILPISSEEKSRQQQEADANEVRDALAILAAANRKNRKVS